MSTHACEWRDLDAWQPMPRGGQNRENTRKKRARRGEGSCWGWALLRSLISCGRRGSRGCTGSFPSAGAWLNSTQFLLPGWTPGFASGRCRRELERKRRHEDESKMTTEPDERQSALSKSAHICCLSNFLHFLFKFLLPPDISFSRSGTPESRSVHSLLI